MRAQRSPAELLVGLKVADDAAVYLVARDVAIVETLDFFPPIVDDAYASGAIGAANAMSDVYAMGGEVLFVLNIAAWPEDAPLSQLERIFQGAIDKVAEAGGVVAGGHTVIDREPKYGLAVTGRVHPERMLLKSRVGVRIRASAVPLLPAARQHAATGLSFGGLERNRAYFDDGARVKFEGVDDSIRTLLLDPQTSGGLLVGVPSAHAEAWQRAMK